MNTNHITIRENEALKKLAERCKDTIKSTTDFLLTKLLELDLVLDEPCHCGMSLAEIPHENNNTLTGFVIKAFKCCSPSILTIMEDIQIWGLENECPDCGCKLIEDEDGIECENDICGCSINFESDPDALRDDRCHYELIGTIHKN